MQLVSQNKEYGSAMLEGLPYEILNFYDVLIKSFGNFKSKNLPKLHTGLLKCFENHPNTRIPSKSGTTSTKVTDRISRVPGNDSGDLEESHSSTSDHFNVNSNHPNTRIPSKNGATGTAVSDRRAQSNQGELGASPAISRGPGNDSGDLEESHSSTSDHFNVNYNHPNTRIPSKNGATSTAVSDRRVQSNQDELGASRAINRVPGNDSGNLGESTNGNRRPETFNLSSHEHLPRTNSRITNAAPQQSHTITSSENTSSLQHSIRRSTLNTNGDVNAQSTKGGPSNTSSDNGHVRNRIKKTSNNNSDSGTLEELRSMRKEMNEGFSKILRMFENEIQKPVPTKPSFIPFKTPHEVHNFGKANSRDFDRLVAYFRYVGGTSLKDAVSNHFNAAITPKCAFAFTMYGKYGRKFLKEHQKPDKTRFYMTKLYKALYCGVSKAYELTDDDFLKVLGERLRTAKQTYRNRVSRSKLQIQSGERNRSVSREGSEKSRSRSPVKSRKRNTPSKNYRDNGSPTPRSRHQSRESLERDSRENDRRSRSRLLEPRNESTSNNYKNYRKEQTPTFPGYQQPPQSSPRDRQTHSRSRSSNIHHKSTSPNYYRENQSPPSRSCYQSHQRSPLDCHNRDKDGRNHSRSNSRTTSPANDQSLRSPQRYRRSQSRSTSKRSSSAEVSERSMSIRNYTDSESSPSQSSHQSRESLEREEFLQNRSRSRFHRYPPVRLRSKSISPKNYTERQSPVSPANQQQSRQSPLRDRQNRSRSRSIGIPHGSTSSTNRDKDRRKRSRSRSRGTSSSELNEKRKSRDRSKNCESQEDSQTYKGRNWDNVENNEEDELDLYEKMFLGRSRSSSPSNSF